MIVFDLRCSGGHRFEGWFNSADDFAAQKKHKILECPTCGSTKIDRTPSATRLNFGAQQKSVPAPQKPEKTPQMEGKDPFAIAQMLYSKMLDDLLIKTEDVGSKFPEKARDIFYRRDEARPIRGQATDKEHDELVSEGIPVARFPIPPKDKLN
jgi:hypothetical protein